MRPMSGRLPGPSRRSFLGSHPASLPELVCRIRGPFVFPHRHARALLLGISPLAAEAPG